MEQRAIRQHQHRQSRLPFRYVEIKIFRKIYYNISKALMFICRTHVFVYRRVRIMLANFCNRFACLYYVWSHIKGKHSKGRMKERYPFSASTMVILVWVCVNPIGIVQ